MDLPRPCVNTRDFESVVPGAGVLALAFETGADAVTVSLAVLPATAVHAAIIKVEAAALDGLVLHLEQLADAARQQAGSHHCCRATAAAGHAR